MIPITESSDFAELQNEANAGKARDVEVAAWCFRGADPGADRVRGVASGLVAVGDAVKSPRIVEPGDVFDADHADEIRAAQAAGARMDFQNTSPFFIHDTSPGALSPRMPRVQPSLIALPPIRKPGRIRLALRRAWRWLVAPRCAL